MAVLIRICILELECVCEEDGENNCNNKYGIMPVLEKYRYDLGIFDHQLDLRPVFDLLPEVYGNYLLISTTFTRLICSLFTVAQLLSIQDRIYGK